MAWVTKYRRRDGGTSYRVGWRDPDGKTHLKTFRRRAAADDHARKIEGDKLRNEYTDPSAGRITLADYFDVFMETSTHLKPSSRALYSRLFEGHVRKALGGRPLASIARSDVKALLAPLSATTARSVHRLIRRVLSASVEDGRIGRNPAAGLKLAPEVRREPRFLSPDEVRRLAAEVPPRYRALILLMAYSGIRVGEAAALRVGDIDFLRGRVTVSRNSVEVEGRLVEGTPKGGSVRTVRIPATVVEELSRHVGTFTDREPASRVFTTEGGAALRQSRFRRHVFTPAASRVSDLTTSDTPPSLSQWPPGTTRRPSRSSPATPRSP